MLASDEVLDKVALDYGFTKDDSVIVTGESQMAAYRVAAVLRYIGSRRCQSIKWRLGSLDWSWL